MTKIKVLGVLIFSLSVILTFLSMHIAHENTHNNNTLSAINKQKALTQEISKNIFYIYNNKDAATEQLEDSIALFLASLNQQTASDFMPKEENSILFLSNTFYKYIQDFQEQNRVTSSYSHIILEKTIKDIYNTNMQLIVAFEGLIKMHQDDFDDKQETQKKIQYILFFLLLVLLMYLFSQLKNVILFMQKFLDTSKRIIANATIKELKPIQFANNNDSIEASTNFNYLVYKMNDSVEYASLSVENAYQSLEIVEKNIEDLLELLCIMQEDETLNKELTKKEDAVILSLEELTHSAATLKNLKKDLDDLICATTLN
ncbi:MAG: hypothetical protein PHH41_04115 [Sulfurimonas sp.]|nr:hypothetical protein [Sulfurimonas sp.]MDD5202307.1 hypothetical protein [Sulfurimonas sp.]